MGRCSTLAREGASIAVICVTVVRDRRAKNRCLAIAEAGLLGGQVAGLGFALWVCEAVRARRGCEPECVPEGKSKSPGRPGFERRGEPI